MDHPFLAGFCRAMGEARVATMRFNFPFIERGRRSPDPERVLRETWLAAFDAATERAQHVLQRHLVSHPDRLERAAPATVAPRSPAAPGLKGFDLVHGRQRFATADSCINHGS